MPRSPTLVPAAIATLLLAPTAAHADWTLWADGLSPGVGPSLTISDQREIFYVLLAPQLDGNGTVYRASLDDPQPVFTAMPTYPLPVPQQATSYNNALAITTNARGEPVVGLSINGNWINTDPLIMTWDEDADTWLAAEIVPANALCNKNIFKMARAPNGDVWATCQWHGAYRSSDDGRTFDYIDVSKMVEASVPSYFPTRANSSDDLGALFGLAIRADGMVVIGSESGGVVHSPDGGTTWLPLDWAPTDPMSTMARATNMGNVAGIGVLPDGRVIAQGGDGHGPYPPEGTIGLYVFDLVAHTTTTATGFPDYILAGLSTGQIVTTASGAMFLHTGRDRVDEMTGEPAFGGLARSSDGLAWALDNDGIDEIFKVANMDLWIDGLGRANAHPFAVDGDDIYVATKTGKIFIQSTDDGDNTTTSSDTADPTTTTNDSTSDDPDPTSSTTSDLPTTEPTPNGSTSTATGDDTSSSPADDTNAGCSCTTTTPPTALTLLVLATLAPRRRRRLTTPP